MNIECRVTSCPNFPSQVGRDCLLNTDRGTSTNGFNSTRFDPQPDGTYKNDAGTVLTPLPLPKGVAPAAPAPGYADGNPKSLQGAKKFSLRYLPLSANIAVNQAFEDGAAKYGAANWREKGVAATVYVDAALRHIMQYFDGGQKLAADSGVHNLGHAMACLAIIIDAEQEGQLIDDRPFSAKDTDALLQRPVK